MTTNERNWLIRTSQNQILGPVQKSKIIEFIQKGALGFNDEVTSGNGYWFLLREKDLVEKYIYGDVPQSYDPISEAKSTLKFKSNPNKTTSLNVSPSNNVTQVIDLKSINLENAIVPNNDDLEFPDVESIKATIQSEASNDIKVPTNDDLEFPDVTIVAKNISIPSSMNEMASVSHADVTVVFNQNTPPVTSVETKNANDAIIPNADDLEFPDMEFISEVKNKIADEVEPIFEVPVHSFKDESSLDFKSNPSFNLSNPDFGLPLELNNKKMEEPTDPTRREKNIHFKPEKKSSISVYNRPEKNSEKERNKEAPRPVPKANREISPELKNRNDTYLFIVLVILVAIIVGIVFYYYRFILNRPLPV